MSTQRNAMNPLRVAPRVAWLTLTLLLLTLSGCGFHLRGGIEIPPTLNPLYLQSAPGSPVRRAIEELLTGSGVRLTASPAEARLILRLLSEGRSARVAAVDANSKILAYELHYLVSFDAIGADGAPLVAPQTIDLMRNFDNPDIEVLGKRLEEELIYRDFAADAADRILMRLRAVLSRPAPPAAPSPSSSPSPSPSPERAQGAN